MTLRSSVRPLLIAATCAGTIGSGAIGLTSVADAATKTLKLTANPMGMFMFNTTTLKAKAGKIKIELINPSSSGLPHALTIVGHGVDKRSKTVQPGHTTSLTLTLKKGTYTFLCPIPGHAAGGMKGTLKIT